MKKHFVFLAVLLCVFAAAAPTLTPEEQVAKRIMELVDSKDFGTLRKFLTEEIIKSEGKKTEKLAEQVLQTTDPKAKAAVVREGMRNLSAQFHTKWEAVKQELALNKRDAAIRAISPCIAEVEAKFAKQISTNEKHLADGKAVNDPGCPACEVGFGLINRGLIKEGLTERGRTETADAKHGGNGVRPVAKMEPGKPNLKGSKLLWFSMEACAPCHDIARLKPEIIAAFEKEGVKVEYQLLEEDRVFNGKNAPGFPFFGWVDADGKEIGEPTLFFGDEGIKYRKKENTAKELIDFTTAAWVKAHQ